MESSKIIETSGKVVKSKYFPYIIIIILLMLIGFFYQKNQNLVRKAAVRTQNLSAMSDTLRTERTKSGAMSTTISAFIGTEKELKELNRELYDELDDQKGKVLTLNRAVVRLIQDTTILNKYVRENESRPGEIVQVNDSTYQAPWTLTYRYDTTNYDIFKGKTQVRLSNTGLVHEKTWMENRETQIGLTWGQRVEDNQLRVFVQSEYPGFTAGSLQGVLIDPNKNPYIKSLIKKRHWFTGFSIGIGTTVGYDLLNGAPGFTIGPTFSWNIYQW